jgi:membrane protease YdiL (CAAX protease family)
VTGPPAVGLAGWAFLVFAGILLPIAAGLLAVAEQRRGDGGAPPGDAAGGVHAPSRIQLYAQALFTHALLLGAALAAARAEGVVLFPRRTIEPRELAAAALTLLAVTAIGELSWRSRSAHERERLWVRRILPHTPSERRAWVLVSAGAAIAEEVAYRGVFVAVATAATGSVAIAVITSAIAFAIVHAPQGLAGVGYVFVIALVHQALVLVTGTLLLAIVVHFAYDVLAGLWLAKRHGLTTPADLGRTGS